VYIWNRIMEWYHNQKKPIAPGVARTSERSPRL
jgi:hypothetical protein